MKLRLLKVRMTPKMRAVPLNQGDMVRVGDHLVGYLVRKFEDHFWLTVPLSPHDRLDDVIEESDKIICAKLN